MLKLKFKKHQGFTLIELLIVICIIGLLAVISVNGYNEIRMKADINIQTDMLITNLREAKNISQNSKQINDQLFCIGFKFENNQTITPVQANYKHRLDPCDVSQITAKSALSEEIKLEVTAIKDDSNTEIPELTILYYPPKGEFILIKDNTAIEPDQIPDKIQISTKLNEAENKNYITILKSGIIHKEVIEP